MANLSKIKREKMLDYLEKLKEINNDDENIRAITEIENALNEKKYGLVWEEHLEKVDEELVHNIPIFVEDENRKITVNEDEPYNFLLEGDNLHSLKLLEKTHKGKIDVIYIDPPYNTGNKDFIYDDSFVDKTDGYAHSKWLSFMGKRLLIAKELLSNNGAIFINIDDNEQAQLKLLCDTVLGESNYITTIPWHNRTSVQNDTDISINHEYILVYAKYKRADNRRLKDSNRDKWDDLVGFTFLPKETDKSKFSNPDNDPRGLWKADPFDAPNIRPNLTYPIINPNTGDQHLPPRGRHWRISQEKFASALEDNRIIFGKNGKGRPQLKVFYNEVKFKGAVADTWFDSHIFGTSTEGKKELLKLLPENQNIFSTPKPIRLYLELMKLSLQSKEAIVLDFFAGSGTTGHAVMQLNKEDGGHRKYILCTNNENNICEEVTYQRLKNIQEDLPHNLKYYKTEFIPKFSDEEDSISDKMMEHIKELIELEYHIELDGKRYLIIEDEDKLAETMEKIENNGSLFVRSGIFLSRSNQRILDEKQVNVIEIPEYYFRDELKEVGEL
ncbi:site-specific DNA-methyltransferase [Sneathia vaginalis]|uniref:site-specific DNA-methyltransferase n=1 Tax=Sneathia vaginalis TaxID=187101 RepID=UPI0025939E2D|nr:site-specific DNA-methyltransferase [uncultured Sneathia sp.]